MNIFDENGCADKMERNSASIQATVMIHPSLESYRNGGFNRGWCQFVAMKPKEETKLRI